MSHTASYRSRLLLLPLLLLLFTELAWGQRVSIQTRLDRSEIRIGEQAAVEMTIRTDDLARTRFHLVEDSTGIERFRVLAFGATDTIDLGGGLKEIQAKMIVTSSYPRRDPFRKSPIQAFSAQCHLSTGRHEPSREV